MDGGGASVSEFLTENPNMKKLFFFYFCWGVGSQSKGIYLLRTQIFWVGAGCGGEELVGVIFFLQRIQIKKKLFFIFCLGGGGERGIE